MNFEFLKSFPDMKKLYSFCSEAEEFVKSKPSISVMSARKAMEFIVKMIYLSVVGEDNKLTVFEMINDPVFIYYVNDDTIINTMHFIRMNGNSAAHNGEFLEDESLKVLEQLHFLVGEFCVLIGLLKDYPEFRNTNNSSNAYISKPKTDKVEDDVKKIIVEPELVAKFSERMRNTKFNVKFKRDEDENKRLYLSACLREAGWAIVTRANQAMPCSVGLNIVLDSGDVVDYIIYGRDNRPLAIVEYTTTKNNIIEGRTKGIEIANKLSIKLGYKPIVYYTNGYHIYVIDQLGYKPRRVFQFHSIEELELFKLRATMRQDITAPVINDSITNRDYQKEAIIATCNAFAQFRRHSLLVMATGTGKTRVSISLVDVLLKANWVKNILFLADRTSLVRQAHKNFNKLLPSVTTSIYAGSSFQRDPNARIIFSTYQTMINLINDDTREFGIGRFDLIIVDEAHRSIFKKYGALFHYFDALMIGLTATPRAEDNKSTYEKFELKNGHPDYAYELEKAIDDGYLVGFSVLDKTTDVLKRGIHYDELSDEEKEKFEDTFATGDAEYDQQRDFKGVTIDSNQIKNSKFINIGTIDVMLNDLMKNGLKVNAGDKIGKTIIFASSHFEAEKIVERFLTLYPYLGLDFCKLIDSQIPNSQGLIDSFSDRDQFPQIAVSVEMLDTGIDVPDVLNLVFFKNINSKIKFLQMIGRGTRLCPNIFGPGLDKKGFLIFDYYDNFNFFRTRNTWSTVNEDTNKTGWNGKINSQSILINKRKLTILRNLIESATLTTFEDNYKNELKSYFISLTQGLCNDDIEVQYNMSYVTKYRTAEQWDGFTNEKVDEIVEHILPLFPADPSPVKVKNFDNLIYAIEANAIEYIYAGKSLNSIRNGFYRVGVSINKMLYELSKLKTIPEITKKELLIQQMKDADLIFNNFSMEICEMVRKELRDLMTYIPDDKRYYVIDTSDYIIDGVTNGGKVTKEKSYADKAQEYINEEKVIFAKIRNLDELTQDEKDILEKEFKSNLGSESDYIAWSSNKPLLPFLRVQVGIADEAITTKFGSFLTSTVLNEQQMTFMNQIISYTRENGDITFLDLQKVSPFCDVDIMSLFGTNITYIKSLINGLHNPVKS